MTSDKKFLGNVPTKEDAIELRDRVANMLVEAGWTPDITVGFEFMSGAGGYGVWLYKDNDKDWPEPPLSWHVLLLQQGKEKPWD